MQFFSLLTPLVRSLPFGQKEVCPKTNFIVSISFHPNQKNLARSKAITPNRTSQNDCRDGASSSSKSKSKNRMRRPFQAAKSSLPPTSRDGPGPGVAHLGRRPNALSRLPLVTSTPLTKAIVPPASFSFQSRTKSFQYRCSCPPISCRGAWSVSSAHRITSMNSLMVPPNDDENDPLPATVTPDVVSNIEANPVDSFARSHSPKIKSTTHPVHSQPPPTKLSFGGRPTIAKIPLRRCPKISDRVGSDAHNNPPHSIHSEKNIGRHLILPEPNQSVRMSSSSSTSADRRKLSNFNSS